MKKSKITILSLAILVLPFMGGCNKTVKTENNLPKTEEVTITIEHAPADISGEYHSFSEEYEGYEAERIMFSTNRTVKDFKFIEIESNEENSNIRFSEASVLYSIDELTPEKPFVVSWLDQGTIPHRGISFIDENNKTRYYYVTTNNADNSINGPLLLVEFE